MAEALLKEGLFSYYPCDVCERYLMYVGQDHMCIPRKYSRMKPLFVVLDGPMGVGKTSLLSGRRVMNFDVMQVPDTDRTLSIREYVIQEKTEDWTNIRLSNDRVVNMLNPDDATAFQRELYIYLESAKQQRMMLNLALSEQENDDEVPLIFVDRGLEPAHSVFAKMDRERSYINPIEEHLLKHTHQVLGGNDNLKPDLILYLNSSLDISKGGVEARQKETDHKLRPEFISQIWDAYQKHRLMGDNVDIVKVIDRDRFQDDTKGLQKEVSKHVRELILKAAAADCTTK